MKKVLVAESKPAEMPGDVMNEAEAAAYLRQKPRTLRLWRRTRGLPFFKLTSKVILFRRADIDAWLAQRRVAMGTA